MKYPIAEDVLKADQAFYNKWRSGILGSSDISIIMNASPWKTRFQLWQEKTGRVKNLFAPSLNAQLGIKYENLMRSFFELKTDSDFAPQIFVSDLYPFQISSLDGWSDDLEATLEIKTVLGMPTYQKALEGKVSEAYIDQVQHQLYVAGGKKCFFYVGKLSGDYRGYSVVDKVLLEVLPDKEHQEKIVKAAIEFHHLVKTDVPPALAERDACELKEPDDIGVFLEIKALKDAGAKIDLQKAKAIEIAKKHHTYVRAGGINLKCTNNIWRVTYASEKE